MIWFAEAYRWSSGSSWLGVVNPLPAPQTVTVAILGRDVTRAITVPARGRLSVELGEWGLSGDFGVEVRCGGPVCAASLVMWDQKFATAHESSPIVGCELAAVR